MIKRVAFITFLIVYCFSFFAFADDAAKKRTIQVTGGAQVMVTPDRIIIRLGVNSKDKELNVAKKQNDERVKRVLKAIRGLGVKEEQIQTAHIGIEPHYERDAYDKDFFTGYLVKNTIAITLKDNSKFDQLLSSALEAGANRVYGINYHTFGTEKAQRPGA